LYRKDPSGTHPPLDSPAYGSTKLRHPLQSPVLLPQKLTEITGPLLGEGRLSPQDNDLTLREPQGQRIIVHGRVMDGDGRPVPNSLVEIWQANAGGRYKHVEDRWPSPVDPAFDGVGRTLTDDEGRYTFTTIKPGAYPWRPAHIHFSLFGRSFVQRLVTQMYFPDDPLFGQDPIFNSIPDPAARARMVSAFDFSRTVPSWALAFSFDIVLRGREATPFEEEDDDE
jgi:protocatechuate 3,4-dioxygenase beta subunit